MRWYLDGVRYALTELGHSISTDAGSVGFKDRPRYAVTTRNGDIHRFDSLLEIVDKFGLAPDFERKSSENNPSL